MLALKCPYCNFEDTKVIDSRTMEGHTAIRRRRMCDKCGERFTTYERIDSIPLFVIKRDGTREAFDAAKLLNGIIKSCNKRPVTMQQMETLVKQIEEHIMSGLTREIESKTIGDLVMDNLKNFDEVAYVRFASVYKQFKDVDTFMNELYKLINDRNI